MKEVTGDILLTSAQALAHSVAINDDFKHGVSAELKEMWPAMYKDFRHFCKTQSPKEGDVWAWKGTGTPVIFSLFRLLVIIFYGLVRFKKVDNI